MRNRIGKVLAGIMLILAILGIAGCTGGGTETGNPAIVSMDTFSSGPELEAYLKDQYASNFLSKKFNPALIGGADADPPSANEDDAGERFSETNIQEQGVDESDKVKTDGAYLYVSGERRVTVVDVSLPDAMKVVSAIDVQGSVDSLYLYNHILVVLYAPDSDSDPVSSYWKPVNGVLFADVTDPSAPERIEEVRFDGMLLSSRLTGGRLHLVQQFFPELPSLQVCHEFSEEDCSGVVAANSEKLGSLTLDDLLPSYQIVDEAGGTIKAGQVVPPENFCRPDEPEGGGNITIMTFDMDDLSQPFQSVGMITEAHEVYASTRSLYLTAGRYEKYAQLDGLNGGGWTQETVIHKFDLTGEDVRHVATGRVPGWILNQFSLGEHEDVLRIATDSGNNIWDGLAFELTAVDMERQGNHVFCLRDQGGALEVVGSVENIAPGEKIYAARFVGTRGYLVTFVQVDPLFTLDLSDPTDPRIVGELKVPGYSDYIHPFGENHILTIGKDTQLEDGIPWYQGVQLSVFDIRDFAAPELLHKELIGARGTGSEALHEHKAFTFWKENDLLAIPIDLYQHNIEPDHPWNLGKHTFSGLYVYRATPADGFEFMGRIAADSSWNGYYSARWTRGLFINAHVYAVTSDAVHVAEVGAIASTVHTLSLGD